MSFAKSDMTARTYAPGWFLADEGVMETRQISATGAETAANGGMYVPMGTIYPSNDDKATGIVYEDVDVTTGDMPGSVVTSGTVYEDRLPEALDSSAKTALQALGFKFVTTPTVTRP